MPVSPKIVLATFCYGCNSIDLITNRYLPRANKISDKTLIEKKHIFEKCPSFSLINNNWWLIWPTSRNKCSGFVFVTVSWCATGQPIKSRMPLDLYIKLGPYKFSLQAPVDYHGYYMNSGHYTASINCCGKTFHCNDNKITDCDITDTYNSSTAYIILYKLMGC